jgi:hypothetical protein
MNESYQNKSTNINKNANNEVDILYNFWLGRWFLVQTLDDLEQTESEIREDISRIRQLLDDEDETRC